MKIFHCGHCEQLVFFENTSCVNCGRLLAYLPDRTDMGTFETDEDNTLQSISPGTKKRAYRLCQNYTENNVCNWAVDVDDPNPYCRSCRLTRVFPDLSQPGAREAWARLETAKRRLLYSLILLELPLANKTEDPDNGLAFEFLADPPPDTPDAVPILTGHDNGLIVINIAEADDAEREKRRHLMHEGYRTILGHFRHEIGHYYWDRLIQGTDDLVEFRRIFGDEREDYGEALQRHYKEGAPANWTDSFVSTYASSHPWEDWAETWAHYLHILDNPGDRRGVWPLAPPQAGGRAHDEAGYPGRRPETPVVRRDHRPLVPVDLCAQQPEPWYGYGRCLPVHPPHPRAR